ncbi:MAG: hypothetical protein IPF55_18790 [Rhodoferax sp.]|nr:hypothetical protein [Rhodoferax sp.]
MDMKLQALSWTKSTNPEYPYQVNWNGHEVEIRVNGFPAAQLYTLIADGVPVESFDNWPTAWERP